jgi:F-type H+-transporting ATPase subunit c
MNRTKLVLMTLLLVLVAGSVMAQGAAPFVPTDHPQQGVVRWGAIAAAFVLGLAAAAGAMGQSRAIVAACEGIARNPGAAGPIRLAMIIGLALIESLVIYALLIAFFVYKL